MTESVTLAIINTIGIIVVAFFQWRSHISIKNVEKQTNHLTTELVKETAITSRAAGKAEGISQQKGAPR